MKRKILVLTFSLLMVTAVFAKAKAGNPIPSYNVMVPNSAYFQEQAVCSTPGWYSPEKRDMNISNDTPGNRPIGTGEMIVYVFRLDGAVTLGPFMVYSGETLSVKIDGNAWGVSTQTNQPSLVSVWTGKYEEL